MELTNIDEINRSVLISIFVLGFVLGGVIVAIIHSFKETRK